MDASRLESFFQGQATDAHEIFGAEVTPEGVAFTVYAPDAKNVQVKGEFNDWDGERGWMEKVDPRGVFRTVIPQAKEYQLYKYAIETREQGWIEKADPYARYSQLRPEWNSIIVRGTDFPWGDGEWLRARTKCLDRPLNIYELHIGGWRRDELGNWYTYGRLEKELIPYLKGQGYNYLELMPLMSFPYDGSWGYQISGFFALTSRYGTVYEFQHFVNACHQAGIGVIMDFVAVHFASDSYGLARFDGSRVYEYANERDAASEWGTYNFDLWKETTRSFLMSAANWWIGNYHLDGLRMDAISNTIFWAGNKNRGVNQGALDFIKRFNYKIASAYPEVMLIAEDSSDYPKVTHPTAAGGLGFDYKWDLGWMNDTLSYFKKDPVYRRYHQNALSFSMMYFWSERFILPLSHDEVVHGKATIVNKMWGLYDQKFAQCKNLFAYMMTHPGKKLNFMGNEFGHFREFDEAKQLDWFLLDYPRHRAFNRAVTDLNRLYLDHPAFWQYDYDSRGFRWIDADNADLSTYAYIREDDRDCFVVLLNMTPMSLDHFVTGVPYAGKYREVYNTDDAAYEGGGTTNPGEIASYKQAYKEFADCITLKLPPFAAVILRIAKPKAGKSAKKIAKG